MIISTNYEEKFGTTPTTWERGNEQRKQHKSQPEEEGRQTVEEAEDNRREAELQRELFKKLLQSIL